MHVMLAGHNSTLRPQKPALWHRRPARRSLGEGRLIATVAHSENHSTPSKQSRSRFSNRNKIAFSATAFHSKPASSYLNLDTPKPVIRPRITSHSPIPKLRDGTQACPPQPWRRRVTNHACSTRHIPEVEFAATRTLSRTCCFLLVTHSSDFAPGPSLYVAAAFRRAAFSFLLALNKPRTYRDASGYSISNRGSAIRNRRKSLAMNHLKISNRLERGGAAMFRMSSTGNLISHPLDSPSNSQVPQYEPRVTSHESWTPSHHSLLTTHQSLPFPAFVVASTFRPFFVESRHAPAHFA